MEKTWSYHDFEIHEGLKPGSEHFQYFFVLSKEGRKKCNYCVWIEDDALPRFGSKTDYEAIASSNREAWTEWVREKIDAQDFRNRVLKFNKSGREEIDLSAMKAKVSMD